MKALQRGRWGRCEGLKHGVVMSYADKKTTGRRRSFLKYETAETTPKQLIKQEKFPSNFGDFLPTCKWYDKLFV